MSDKTTCSTLYFNSDFVKLHSLPPRLRKQFGEASSPSSASSPSIFAEANIVMAKEHCHVLQTTGTTPTPHLAASYYSVHLDEAHFTLANSLGNVFIVKMGNLKERNDTILH